jgi:hypothetical protein
MVAEPALVPLRRWDPERIGPYVLLGRLGAGRSGQVFLGSTAGLRWPSRPSRSLPRGRVRGGSHEVAAARRVSGRFIAAVVAADADADVPWLATAYVPGRPGHERCDRGLLPVLHHPVAGHRGCAEALESIHTAGLVHRDLAVQRWSHRRSPAIDSGGQGRRADPAHGDRGAVGTPAYMVPEQRATRQASAASDMFSSARRCRTRPPGTPRTRRDCRTCWCACHRAAGSGRLPGELTDLVTSCPVQPQEAPPSAGLLSQLGPFVATRRRTASRSPDRPRPWR